MTHAFQEPPSAFNINAEAAHSFSAITQLWSDFNKSYNTTQETIDSQSVDFTHIEYKDVMYDFVNFIGRAYDTLCNLVTNVSYGGRKILYNSRDLLDVIKEFEDKKEEFKKNMSNKTLELLNNQFDQGMKIINMIDKFKDQGQKADSVSIQKTLKKNVITSRDNIKSEISKVFKQDNF